LTEAPPIPDDVQERVIRDFQQKVNGLAEQLAEFRRPYCEARPQLVAARRNLPYRPRVTALGEDADFAHDIVERVADGVVRWWENCTRFLPAFQRYVRSRIPGDRELHQLLGQVKVEYEDAAGVLEQAKQKERTQDGTGRLEAPADPRKAGTMATSDNPAQTAFQLTCDAACGCAEGVETMRQVWEDYREFGATGMSHGEAMGHTLLRLTYNLKRARTLFPAVRETIRAVHSNPPEAIAGVAGASYHDIAIKLADNAVWEVARTALLGCEILDVLAGPDLPEKDLRDLLNSRRPQVLAKFCYDRDKAPPGMWDDWKQSLDRLPTINSEPIIAWVQKEAARGAAAAQQDPAARKRLVEALKALKNALSSGPLNYRDFLGRHADWMKLPEIVAVGDAVARVRKALDNGKDDLDQAIAPLALMREISSCVSGFVRGDEVCIDILPVAPATLRELDQLIGDLGGPQAAQAANPPEATTKPRGVTAAGPVDPVAEPKPEHFQAYWFQQWGYTQKRIAELLKTNQGTISKWLGKVERWKAAGNIIPEIPKAEPLDSKPAEMDPTKLDLGPRSDHRAPHQAEKLAGIQGHDGEE
jgi:hypothetical protein